MTTPYALTRAPFEGATLVARQSRIHGVRWVAVSDANRCAWHLSWRQNLEALEMAMRAVSIASAA